MWRQHDLPLRHVRCTAAVIMFPFDVVKSRLQFQGSSNTVRSGSGSRRPRDLLTAFLGTFVRSYADSLACPQCPSRVIGEALLVATERLPHDLDRGGPASLHSRPLGAATVHHALGRRLVRLL